MDSGCHDFLDNVWRDVLAQLVDFHTKIFRVIQQYRDTEELSRLALNYGQALLQLIGWGGEGDIEVPIRIAQEVFEGCCARGDFDSRITIQAFELSGDSHRLGVLGDELENLECSARCYLSCIRRISDLSDFGRLSNLVKLSDVAISLVARGQRHWWRDAFGALEELIANIVRHPQEVQAGRRAQTAMTLWEFAENAPLMPMERRHIAARAMELADELLKLPVAVTDIAARSELCALLLSAAIMVYPFFGINVLHSALKQVGLSHPGYLSWAHTARMEHRRIVAQALAFSRVRANLLLASKILEEDIPLKSGDKRGKDHLLLAAIYYALLHDGQRFRLLDADKHLSGGLREHTGPKCDTFVDWSHELGTKLSILQHQIDGRDAQIKPGAPTDQSKSLIAEPTYNRRPDTALDDGIGWTANLDFRLVCRPIGTKKASPITGYEINDKCPSCSAAYHWTAHIYIDERAQSEIFAKITDPGFRLHTCNHCGAILKFVFPLFVQRRWSNYPMVAASPDIETANAKTSMAAVRQYLENTLPSPGRQSVAHVLYVPMDVLADWMSIADAPPEFAMDTFPRAIKIHCQSEIVPGSKRPLLSDDTPPVFLHASRDGYEHRLDPVSRFRSQREYRRRELLSWLDWPDSEAVLERRDALSLFAYGDTVVIDDMIACGMPLVRSGFDHWLTFTVNAHLDLLAVNRLFEDQKVSENKNAASIVRNAVLGRGDFILFLRSFSLEIPKLKREDMIRDPYGFPRESQFGMVMGAGETPENDAAAYLSASLPVVGISDHLSVLGGESSSLKFAKFRVKSSEWVDVASLLIEHAKRIVLFYADVTAGTRWELKEIEAFGAEGKTGVFSCNRYFVQTMSFEATIEGETWRSVFDDPTYASRFAFVHPYGKDDDAWKRCLDDLISNGPTPAKP